MKKTPLTTTKERIEEIKAKREVLVEDITARQAEARSQIEEASIAMKKATEELDAEAYEKAKGEKHKAQTALEMYNNRFSQIQKQELISEEESDKIVDSLLYYEEDLTEDFKRKLLTPLQELRSLVYDYLDEIDDIENVLKIWQEDIHANYNTRGGTMFIDKETGIHTTRSETPVPVHRLPYKGCAEANRLKDYLKDAL